MPLLDRIQLDSATGLVSRDDFNRLQTNVERALKKLHDAQTTSTVRIVTTILGGLIGGLTYDLGNDILGDNSGVEKVLWQRRVQTGAAGTLLKVSLLGDVKSASGTAYVRLRLGGGDRTVDGTIIVAASVPFAVFVAMLSTVPIVSPGGMQHMKLTVQSSAAASMAQIKDGCVVLQ